MKTEYTLFAGLWFLSPIVNDYDIWFHFKIAWSAISARESYWVASSEFKYFHTKNTLNIF